MTIIQCDCCGKKINSGIAYTLETRHRASGIRATNNIDLCGECKVKIQARIEEIKQALKGGAA